MRRTGGYVSGGSRADEKAALRTHLGDPFWAPLEMALPSAAAKRRFRLASPPRNGSPDRANSVAAPDTRWPWVHQACTAKNARSSLCVAHRASPAFTWLAGSLFGRLRSGDRGGVSSSMRGLRSPQRCSGVRRLSPLPGAAPTYLFNRPDSPGRGGQTFRNAEGLSSPQFITAFRRGAASAWLAGLSDSSA